MSEPTPMTAHEFHTLTILNDQRDIAANKAAALLARLVNDGIVTLPLAAGVAKEWENAHRLVTTAHARHEARIALKKASEQ
jgi:hypothetical protein